MRKITVLGSLAAAGFAAGAMGSCVSAKGASWPETLAQAGAPTEDRAHVVLLRPDQRYDDASLSRIVVRIDGRVIGKLAYGGFLLADVPAGELTLEVSAKNRFYGTCKLALRVAAGETKYFDTAPRPANIAAGAIGVLVGGSVVGGATPTACGSGGRGGGRRRYRVRGRKRRQDLRRSLSHDAARCGRCTRASRSPPRLQ